MNEGESNISFLYFGLSVAGHAFGRDSATGDSLGSYRLEYVDMETVKFENGKAVAILVWQRTGPDSWRSVWEPIS